MLVKWDLVWNSTRTIWMIFINRTDKRFILDKSKWMWKICIWWLSAISYFPRLVRTNGPNDIVWWSDVCKKIQGYFVYVRSQWETTLQCNVASHWLGAYTKWSLCKKIRDECDVVCHDCSEGYQPEEIIYECVVGGEILYLNIYIFEYKTCMHLHT